MGCPMKVRVYHTSGNFCAVLGISEARASTPEVSVLAVLGCILPPSPPSSAVGDRLQAHAQAVEIDVNIFQVARSDDRVSIVGHAILWAIDSASPVRPLVCPDCKGTRIYVGIGFFSAEPCRACCGQAAPVADDDALPEGMRWHRNNGAMHPHVIMGGESQLWINSGGVVCGSLRDRPDVNRLVRLLRKKNGVGE